jgi:ADP-ribose pyrophosphatase YjhB (NUDIX family)
MTQKLNGVRRVRYTPLPANKMVFPRAFQSYIPRTHCVNTHVYGAVLLTEARETVVVLGRHSGKWSFPKGHGVSRELPLEACLRELKEETGIDMAGVLPDEELRFKGGTYFVFYMKNRVELSPQDRNEVEQAMWVSIHRLPQLLCNRDLFTFHKSVNADTLIEKISLIRQAC